MMASCGSSPLARGLRWAGASDDGVVRIIPARAGFTVMNAERPDDPADHPRSRGVYQCGAGRGWVARWIIPARAGFTSPGTYPSRQFKDHPRSRGVYLVPFGCQGGGDGIIPARAGFTPIPRRRIPAILDHPRSRGVYAGAAMIAGSAAGSSPLARGLPTEVHQPTQPTGIIPARAGFTRRTGRPGGRQSRFRWLVG